MNTYLALSWGTSRGRDTYGYTICRLRDQQSGKVYRCNGGGYDMVGTVFGAWLEDVCQAELRAIGGRAQHVLGGLKRNESDDALYGMTQGASGEIGLDGACGIESMQRIAEAIGLKLERTWDRKGNTTGWFVELGQ